MSQDQIPIPYSEGIIAGLSNRLTPADEAMEGNLNVYQETIPVSVTLPIFKIPNPYRKTLTLINGGSVPLFLMIKNKQNIESEIPIIVGGSISFDQIIRGHAEQCINGLTIVQYLTTCEYMGTVRIKNKSAITQGNLTLVEGV